MTPRISTAFALILTLALPREVAGQFATATPSRVSDAFALAIQHFNPEHLRPFEEDNPEHRMMHAALTAIDSAFPLLRKFYKPSVASADAFRGLWTTAGHFRIEPPERAAALDTLRHIARALGEGCPGDSVRFTWHRLQRYGTSMESLDSVRYVFGDDGPNRTCAHPLADVFARYGLDIMAFADRNFERIANYGSLTFTSRRQRPRDMEYVRRQLMADSATAMLAARVRPWPLDMGPIDPPWDITVVERQSPADFRTAIVLRYSWRTGDCNPQCPERYAWIVEAKPIDPAGQQAITDPNGFRVRMRREEGSPLGARELEALGGQP